MPNKITLYILLGVLLIFNSCKSSESNTTKVEGESSEESNEEVIAISLKEHDVSWLEGTWVDSVKFGFKNEHYYESWNRLNSSLFELNIYSIKDKVVNQGAKITLKKTEKKYYYSYLYNDKQFTYYSDSLSDNYLRLISATDKFPQTKEYLRVNDTLFITLSGIAGGIYRSPRYTALKIKE